MHLWDTSRIRYPWLESGAELASSYSIEQYAGAAGSNVAAAVFVEAGAAQNEFLNEARWVSALAGQWKILSAMVAGATVSAPLSLDAHLDHLQSFSLVRGVRQSMENLELGPSRRAAIAYGLRMVAERGFTFDACIRHTQFADFVKIVESSPEVDVVIDHLGKPPVAAGIRSPEGKRWRHNVRQAAQLPRVRVKISGLAPEAGDQQTFNQQSDAFVDYALEQFGPSRSILGSDWPVSAERGARCTISGWSARVMRVVGGPGAEWGEVAYGAGATFYRLA
nr:amidohydrolase family protein [Microbacterium sp. MF43]